MKFNWILSSLLLGAAGLSSCNLEPDTDSNYQTQNYTVCNLVIPADAPSFATKDAAYSLTYYMTNGTVSVQTTNLSLGYGNTNFTTSAMPYTAQGYTDGQNYYEVTKFSGGISNTNEAVVNNLSGFTSSIVNLPLGTDPVISNYPTRFNVALVMQYVINSDFIVKTFARDAVYTGTTTVMTTSTGETFSNDEGRYRVYIKDDMKHADIIFYSAKFAPNMPSGITFVLQDLDVVYNKTGYAIQLPGTEPVVPLWYSNGELLPFPAYKFTNFLFTTTSNDLTTSSMNYSVAGTGENYYVMFNGSYVRSGSSDQQ